MKSILRITALVFSVILLISVVFNVTAAENNISGISYAFFLDGGEREIIVDGENGKVTVVYNYVVLYNSEVTTIPVEKSASENGLYTPCVVSVIERQDGRIEIISGFVLESEYDPQTGIGDEIKIPSGSTIWYDSVARSHKVTVNGADYAVGFNDSTKLFAEKRNSDTNEYEGVIIYTSGNFPKLSKEEPNLESGIIKINRNNSGEIISYSLSAAYSVNGNKLIYSPEQIDFTISFDACGGSTTTKNKAVKYGKAYGALPIPQRDGYEFNGWYILQNGEKEYITSSSIVSLRDNHTLYAEWKNAYVPYTYGFYIVNAGTGTLVDPEDGTVSRYDNIIVFSGGKVLTVPVASAGDLEKKSVITLKGMSSDNLYKADNGIISGDEYNGESGSEIKISDSTLWYDPLNKTYIVTVDGVDYNVNLDEKSELYVKKVDSYGYYDGVVSYTQNNMLKLSNEAPNISDGIICINKEVPDNVTYTLLIAYCADSGLLNIISDETQVTVTFDAGEGSVSGQTKSAEFGFPYGVLPTPQREGYKFNGWYTQDGIKITDTTTVRLNHSHTLYAEWEEVQFIYGDVTGDGNVGVSDVITMLKRIAGGTLNELGENGKKASDVNGDGRVDVSDAIRILKHIANPSIPLTPSK